MEIDWENGELYDIDSSFHIPLNSKLSRNEAIGKPKHRTIQMKRFNAAIRSKMGCSLLTIIFWVLLLLLLLLIGKRYISNNEDK